MSHNDEFKKILDERFALLIEILDAALPMMKEIQQKNNGDQITLDYEFDYLGAGVRLTVLLPGAEEVE